MHCGGRAVLGPLVRQPAVEAGWSCTRPPLKLRFLATLEPSNVKFNINSCATACIALQAELDKAKAEAEAEQRQGGCCVRRAHALACRAVSAGLPTGQLALGCPLRCGWEALLPKLVALVQLRWILTPTPLLRACRLQSWRANGRRWAPRMPPLQRSSRSSSSRPMAGGRAGAVGADGGEAAVAARLAPVAAAGERSMAGGVAAEGGAEGGTSSRLGSTSLLQQRQTSVRRRRQRQQRRLASPQQRRCHPRRSSGQAARRPCRSASGGHLGAAGTAGAAGAGATARVAATAAASVRVAMADAAGGGTSARAVAATACPSPVLRASPQHSQQGQLWRHS